jgi:outer membrane protein, heavy metal efflux system
MRSHARSFLVASRSPTTRSRLEALCAVIMALGVSTSVQAAPAIDEAAGVRRVCTESPAATAARAERLAGDAVVVTAGVLPNPQASVQHQRALIGPTEPETIIGLSVPLGIGGRRWLLQDAASARREQAQATAHATLLDAALEFRAAYVTAVLDEARVAVLDEQQRTIDGLGVTLEGLAKRGESTAYAQKRHETQASLHRRLLTSMKARAAASRALLGSWLGEDVELTKQALADLAGGKRTAEGETGTHPHVASLDAAARANSIEARAANRNWIPDVTVFAGYRTITLANVTARGISASVTIPLTMFDHGQGEAAQAEANRARAQAAADGLRREHTARLKAASTSLAMLEASVAEVDRTAKEAASLGTNAVKLYAAGEATIVEVFDAFRAAEEAQLAAIDLAEEIARARIARMKAAGTQFDTALDQACGGAKQ